MEPSKVNLEGRCGTCGFFVRLHPQPEDRWDGECRLKCWPSPLSDAATCASYVRPNDVRKELGKAQRAQRGGQRTRDTSALSEKRVRVPIELDWDMETSELKEILRAVLQEELGIGNVDMAERWMDGEIVLKPGKEGVQEKRIPLNALFHKIVMIRDKLRVLEQKINTNNKLDDEEKVQLQHYITGCYGSLTTFNVLFHRREDGFAGQSSD